MEPVFVKYINAFTYIPPIKHDATLALILLKKKPLVAIKVAIICTPKPFEYLTTIIRSVCQPQRLCYSNIPVARISETY